MGLFDDLEDSVRASLQAEIQYFGEWAPTCYKDFDEALKARMVKLNDLKRQLKVKSKGVSFNSKDRVWSAAIVLEASTTGLVASELRPRR